MAPVVTVRDGDDARLALARFGAYLAAANGNLVCSRIWQERVKRGYGAH